MQDGLLRDVGDEAERPGIEDTDKKGRLRSMSESLTRMMSKGKERDKGVAEEPGPS